jgi:HPt (histidine-containing phosphotransfer) domain-containing protein
MASDREACLAAGMNDHVGKPFDLSNLVATLLHHTGRAPASVQAHEPRAGAPSELLEEAQRRGIALAAALGRMGGNSPAYLRTLQSFAKDLATLPDRLASLLQEGRFDESKRLMHTVKGTAGTLGIRPLASLAADAERCLCDAEPHAPQDDLIGPLRTLVAVTMRDIDHVADKLQQSLHPDLARLGDVPGLRRSLDEMSVLLRAADMRALEVFERLPRSDAAHVTDALKALDEAMATLDFDQALSQCGALQQRLNQ